MMSENENIGSREFYDLFELCEYLKIPDDWLEIPGAEALIPVNPRRWVKHAAGSILSQEPQTADAKDLLAKPFTNLATGVDYLKDSHNKSHFASRATEVFVDTVRVNGLSEVGNFPGNVGSGVYANWAADKYKVKMEIDLQNLPSNATKAYTVKKQRIADNAQQKQKAVNKVLTEMNPKIGNANPSPTVNEFGRNNSRSLWTRKFFGGGGGPRGGAQTYVIEIPTNKNHLYHQQKKVNYHDVDGSIVFTIIFIFVVLVKKTRYRFHKMKIKFSNLFTKVKIKFKRKKNSKKIISQKGN